MKMMIVWFDQHLRCTEAVNACTQAHKKVVEVLPLPDDCQPVGMEYADLIGVSAGMMNDEYKELRTS